MAIWLIARLTLHEAARKKLLLAGLLLGLIFLAVYGFGFYEIQSEIRISSNGANRIAAGEVGNFMFMAGLYVVNFLTLIMTVLISADTLAGEIASGTIHVLVSKPLRRWEVTLGKCLGFITMFTLYLALMTGGVIGISHAFSSTRTPNLYAGLALLWLNGLLVLAVSLAGSARLSTLTNGVLVFGLYGVAFLGGWVEQIGSIIQKQAAVEVGIAASLIFPSEALWKRAAFEMQSPLFSVAAPSLFAPKSPPSGYMITYAVIYTTVALVMAIWNFNRRDL
jgi:Cu-processing system permease protein